MSVVLNYQLGAPEAAILKENTNNLGVYIFMMEKLICLKCAYFHKTGFLFFKIMVVEFKRRRRFSLLVCVCHGFCAQTIPAESSESASEHSWVIKVTCFFGGRQMSWPPCERKPTLWKVSGCQGELDVTSCLSLWPQLN